MQSFDVQQFIDRQRLKAVHYRVLAMLTVVMFIDGFDIFVVGKIAPAIAADFGVTPAAMTLVFLLQQIGLAVGAFLVSPLFDKFGRKRSLMLCCGVFGLLSVATTFATSIVAVAVLRGLAGLFLAAVLPGAVALVAEFTPERRRSTFIALSIAGYSAGSAAGAAAALLIPAYGWQAAFWIGGLLPLALVPLLGLLLPESLTFRVERNPQDPAIARTLALIEPELQLTGEERFVTPERPGKGGKAHLVDVFRDGRARTTTLVWLACLLSMGNIALLAAWLPTFFQEMAGISIQRFAVVSMIGFLGGMVGTVTIGFLMDRFAPNRLIPLYYLGIAATLVLIGTVPFESPYFVPLLLAWSFCQSGGQAGLNMLMTRIYPTAIRSTGIGWAGGAGRIGGIIAPLLGGLALASAFSLQFTLAIIAISPAIVALLVANIRPMREDTLAGAPAVA